MLLGCEFVRSLLVVIIQKGTVEDITNFLGDIYPHYIHVLKEYIFPLSSLSIFHSDFVTLYELAIV
jgi:hypothetical protein